MGRPCGANARPTYAAPGGPHAHEETALQRLIEATDREIDAQILRAVRADGGRDQDCGGASIAEENLIASSNSKKHGV